MAESIGICVSTQNNLHHVIGLAKAAKKAGKQVEIFFTGDGVELTQDPRFSELIDIAQVAVCEVSYIDRGYGKKSGGSDKGKGKAVRGFTYESGAFDGVSHCQHDRLKP
jgi:sulfur relay (sulfurtransferase) complex TusBCD TusD component (DsrE family)